VASLRTEADPEIPMSAHAKAPAAAAVQAREEPMAGGSKWRNLSTYVSILLLVGTEIYAIAIGAAWAMGGMFDLGTAITIGLYVLCLGTATWAMYAFARRAWGVDSRMDAEESQQASSGSR
jgi:uncharacterized membrane protein